MCQSLLAVWKCSNTGPFMFDKLHIGVTARDKFHYTCTLYFIKSRGRFRLCLKRWNLSEYNVEYIRTVFFIYYISLEFSVMLILKEASHCLYYFNYFVHQFKLDIRGRFFRRVAFWDFNGGSSQNPSLLSRFWKHFTVFVSVDFRLDVLTWRENYAGSSGLSSAKRSTDLINTRIADGALVRRAN